MEGGGGGKWPRTFLMVWSVGAVFHDQKGDETASYMVRGVKCYRINVGRERSFFL